MDTLSLVSFRATYILKEDSSSLGIFATSFRDNKWRAAIASSYKRR